MKTLLEVLRLSIKNDHFPRKLLVKIYGVEKLGRSRGEHRKGREPAEGRSVEIGGVCPVSSAGESLINTGVVWYVTSCRCTDKKEDEKRRNSLDKSGRVETCCISEGTNPHESVGVVLQRTAS